MECTSLSKFLFCTWICLMVHTIQSVNDGPPSVGCYSDDLDNPEFASSPGGYDPTLMNPSACSSACKSNGEYYYAGIQDGIFCVCSNTKNKMTTVAESECNSPCSDNSTTSACGGPNGITSIYEAETGVPLSGLALTASASVVTVMQEVTFAISLESGANVNFKMDYGDGQLTSHNNATGMLKHKFSIPGLYFVTCDAFDSYKPQEYITSAVTIDVQQTMGDDILIECPELVDPEEEFICNITLVKGPAVTMDIAKGDGSVNTTYSLPATPYVTLGNGVPQVETADMQNDTIDGVILMSGKVADMQGYVVALEVYVSKAGNIDFLILTPLCSSGAFCYSTGQCESTCSTPSDQVSCSSSNVFHPSSQSCASGSTSRPYDVANYAQKDKYPYAATSPGYLYIDLAQLNNMMKVQPGDVFAIQLSGGAAVAFRNASTAELSSGQTDKTAPSVNGPWTESHTSRYARAIVANPGPASVPYAYAKTGNYTFDVTCTDSVTKSQVVNSTLIKVAVGIGAVNVTIDPVEWASNTAVNITTQVINGSDFTIQWDFGDGTQEQQYESGSVTEKTYPKEHIYTTDGSYTINVFAYNFLDNETDFANVNIEYPVTNQWNLKSDSPQVCPPGGVNFTLEHPAGQLPTNATAMVTWGDGSANTTIPLPNGNPASTTTIPFSHTFIKGGQFNVSVFLSNHVSNKSVAVEVIMYEKIDGLSAKVYYTGEQTGSTPKEAIGPDRNSVPINSNINLEVTAARGTITGFMLYKADGTWIQNSTTSPIYFSITEDGSHHYVVYAYNSVQGKSDPLNVTIVVQQITAGLEIDDSYITTDVNETKIFEISIGSTGSDICMMVFYNDTQDDILEAYGKIETCLENYTIYDFVYKHDIAPAMNISHIFAKKGIYSISVMIFNSLSISNASLVFTVTNFPCTKPTVVMENAQTFIQNAARHFKSGGVRVEAVTTIDCTKAVTTKKQWYVHKVDATFGLEKEMINISSISSHNKSTLYVPPLFLDYGFYKFVFVISIVTDGMDPAFPWKRSLYTYIEITPSDLIPILVPGSMSRVIRGLGQHLNIEPSINSIDPDFPNDKVFNVSWLCHRVVPTNESLPMVGNNFDLNQTIAIPNENDIKPSSDQGGCFGTGAGALKTNNESFNINTKIFYASLMSYEIIAIISKGKRRAEGRIVIDVIDESPPNVNIRCQNTEICFPFSDGLLINPTHRLGAYADCIEDCEEPLIYEWSVYDRDGETLIPEATEYMTGSDCDKMAINSGFFGNTSMPNVFHLVLSIIGSNGDTGKSTMYLHVNRPPKSGSCAMQPNTGQALLQLFKISCTEWVDPEGNNNLTYTIYAIIEEPYGKTILSTGPKRSLDVTLPYGNIQILVEIADPLGAFEQVEVENLTTTMPTKEEYEAFMASNYTNNVIGGGDPEKICQLLLAISSIENSGLLDSPSEEGSNNTNSTSEAEKKQIAESDRIVNHLEAISTLTASSLLEMEMMSATAATIIGEGKYVDSRGKQSVANLLGDLSDTLEHNITLRSPDDAKDLATSTFAIMGSLFNSISSVVFGEDVLAVDFDNLNFMEYDTEPKPNFQMQVNLQDMKKGAIIDDTSYQAKEQAHTINKFVNCLAKKILHELVPNETPITVDANGVNARIAKLLGRNVSKETMTMGDASITFPTYCQLMRINNCNENNSIGIQAINWPSIVHPYGDNIKCLANNTKTIQIDIYNENDLLMDISNLTEPMDIFIPRRKYNGTITFDEPVRVNVSIRWNEFMMYHQFNISNPGSSINIEITVDDPQAPIIIFVRFQKKPTIYVYDMKYRLTDIRLKNGTTETFDLFISSLNVGNKTGIFYLGVAELTENATSSGQLASNNTSYDMFLQNFTTSYSLRIYTSGCYFFDEVSQGWINKGCWVCDSNFWMTHCKCNHLTTFGSGFFVMPNTVDFNYVFAHASFNDNLTIYLTLIITFVIFILMAIWARWKDRKDLEKLGASPLPDNLKADKYIYEILVYTGSKPNSPTDSTVYFILSGDDDETEVRRFGDEKRKIFRKGEMNVFIMAVSRPLGSLNYMRVWHDNSGKGPNASWYLNYIVVRDIQTGDKFEFIANCWFALEDGDGSIDRLLPVAGREQLSEFGHLFSNTSQKEIADGHLWFSVFLRPPRSRFTRLQRVGCCVAFLYLSMLVNAMWYGTVNTSSNSSAFKIGPFSLSTEQIGVGIMSNLIVFPISFVIVYLFRKSRIRKLRPSRIEEALQRQRLKDEKEALDQASLSSLNGSKQKLLNSDALQNQTNKVNGLKKAPIRKKKFTLPWFFKLLAWLLVFACIGVSVFFLWAYGITFGNEKTKKWITSLVISFFSSILITEPIQLFLMAILFSAICKKTEGDDDDDADEDEEDPMIMSDEEYLYRPTSNVKRTRYHPPNPEALEKARALRLKEIKMWAIIREIMGYLTFLWVLIVVSYGNRDPNSFYLKQTLYKEFIQESGGVDFMSMKSTADYWNWTRQVLIKGLHAQNLYNDKPPFGFKGFLNDQVNRMIGHAIMRQIRIKRGMCDAPKEVANISGRCSGAFTDIFAEDETSYTLSWNATVEDPENTPVKNTVEDAFRYKTAESLDGYPFVGFLDMYGAGGYVVHLKGRTSALSQQLDDLEKLQWIDKYSRAVLIEFSVYNTQVNLFGVCTIQLEFVPGGGYFQNFRFDGIRLLEYHDGFGLVVLICEVLFVLSVLYFTFREISEVCKEKKKWCKSYWNYMEVVIILTSYASMVTYVFRKIYTDKILERFNATKGNEYVNLQYVYLLDQLFGGFLAFVVFLATLKFIKLLRFNKRMGILSSTLSNAWNELAVFGIFFIIVFFSFVQLFYLLMSATSIDFSSFLRTMEYSFSMMLNKFNFDEIKMGSPVLGPMAFFIFSLMTSIILINLFLTIVIRSFEDVAHNIFKQPNEYEIVDFILKRFLGFMGISGSPKSPAAPIVPPNCYIEDEVENKNVKGLPQKVDRLLNYINSVHFDGKIDLRDRQNVKNLLGNKKGVLTDSN